MENLLSEACCFSGHREIPAAERESLPRLLDEYVENMYRRGICQFICGGAVGFDALAARAVLRAREQCCDIRLTLTIPYRGVEKHRSEADRLEFEDILSQADSVHYIAQAYSRDCMLRRNRYMVDRSRVCICYMTETTGGTVYTVGYALKNGLEIINLAMEM